METFAWIVVIAAGWVATVIVACLLVSLNGRGEAEDGRLWRGRK